MASRDEEGAEGVTDGAREEWALPSVPGGQGKGLARAADQSGGRRVRDRGKEWWCARGVERGAGKGLRVGLWFVPPRGVWTVAARRTPTAPVTEEPQKRRGRVLSHLSTWRPRHLSPFHKHAHGR